MKSEHTKEFLLIIFDLFEKTPCCYNMSMYEIAYDIYVFEAWEIREQIVAEYLIYGELL